MSTLLKPTTDTVNTRKPLVKGSRRFSTAPMMDWSDKHCRYFWRTLSKEALLYTEMVTTGAIIHGDGGAQRFLGFNDEEHPVALQLGGSKPDELAQCAKIAEQFGYDEVNLNVGCPSDRVQNNMIGACLMGHPQLVADCIKSMQDACDIPVTIKHRIGIDDQDSYEQLHSFVKTIADTGCETFIVHARKAILQGLSPKQNREVPPLKYEFVKQLKQDFPQLEILINGGLQTIEQMKEVLEFSDGVMIGREAYHNPALLLEVDHEFYGHGKDTRELKAVIRNMYPYIDKHLSQDGKLAYITRHLLGLFNGLPGSRQFRRHLSEQAYKKTATLQVIEDALAFMPDQAQSPETPLQQLSN
ncbi:MAG: tRNA-dihydrouridine synthase A [Psychrobacter glaciei]